MKNIAILASGKGTNAKKLLEKAQHLDSINVKVLITDKNQIGAIEVAKEFDISYYVVERNKLTQIEHEIEIIKILNAYKVQWIFLAGYMRILSNQFIRRYYDKNIQTSRIINIHPSLLPAYKGLHAFERAYKDNVNESGITVHFVNEEVDGGKIIKQVSFQRSNQDTFEDFVHKGKLIEHSLYPEVLELLANNKLFLRNMYESRYN